MYTIVGLYRQFLKQLVTNIYVGCAQLSSSNNESKDSNELLNHNTYDSESLILAQSERWRRG